MRAAPGGRNVTGAAGELCGQVAVKTGGPTFRPVDVADSSLVTDAVPTGAAQLQSPGDLLQYPTAAFELVDDVAPQGFVPAQLAPPLAALPGAILRSEWEVPGILPPAAGGSGFSGFRDGWWSGADRAVEQWQRPAAWRSLGGKSCNVS